MSYEKHAELGHEITRYSPDGIDIIEECLTCGARWLHNPCFGYPIKLSYMQVTEKEGDQ